MRSCHCECFTRTSGSICKYTCIKPLDYTFNKLWSWVIVHLLCRAILIENSVEEISLLLASVKHIWLFAFDLAFHFNSIEHQLQESNQNQKQKWTYQELVFGSYDDLITILDLLLSQGSYSYCHNHIWIVMIFVQKFFGCVFSFLNWINSGKYMVKLNNDLLLPLKCFFWI